MQVLQARALTRRLGPTWALRGVDLDLVEGRMVMLNGPNGAGKTTLVRVLATALRPTAGSLHLFGRPLEAVDRARVGLLTHADGHYDALSARENLRVAAALGPVRRPLEEVLELVGLAPRADDMVGTYSAGMRKRLAFARLLMKDPDLVLLDEPYAQLDPSGHALVDGLLAAWRAGGRTVLVSTHMVSRVASLVDDAVRLEGGRIIWNGPASEALAAAPGPGPAGE